MSAHTYIHTHLLLCRTRANQHYHYIYIQCACFKLYARTHDKMNELCMSKKVVAPLTPNRKLLFILIMYTQYTVIIHIGDVHCQHCWLCRIYFWSFRLCLFATATVSLYIYRNFIMYDCMKQFPGPICYPCLEKKLCCYDTNKSETHTHRLYSYKQNVNGQSVCGPYAVATVAPLCLLCLERVPSDTTFLRSFT